MPLLLPLLNLTQSDGAVGLGDGEGRDGWKGFLVQSPSRLQNQGTVSLQAHSAPELLCMAHVWLLPAQLHTIAQHPSVLLSGSKTQSEDLNLTSAILISPLSLWSGGIFFFFFKHTQEMNYCRDLIGLVSVFFFPLRKKCQCKSLHLGGQSSGCP